MHSVKFKLIDGAGNYVLNYLNMKLYIDETKLYKLYYRHFLATANDQRNSVANN